MFKRTNSGLSAEHRFYKTEIIIYCEGLNNDNEICFDEQYWSKLFEKFDIKIKYKCVGSKKNLLPLMESIISGAENIIVALDRDYDSFFGSTYIHERIIYTYGYSFETDMIFLSDIIKIGKVFVNIRNEKIFHDEINHFLSKIEDDLKRATIIDAYCINSPIPLFDRDKPLSIISLPKNVYPALNKEQFLKNIIPVKSELPSDTPKPIIPKEVSGVMSFFGKTVAYMLWSFYRVLAKKYKSNRSINYDLFVHSVITNMDIENNDNIVKSYYQTCISKIKTSLIASHTSTLTP